LRRTLAAPYACRYILKKQGVQMVKLEQACKEIVVIINKHNTELNKKYLVSPEKQLIYLK
jgi:hypothetical protein